MDHSIQISDEDYKFLKDLVHKLNTQDRLGTAQPVRYTIRSKEYHVTDGDFSYDKVSYYDPETNDEYRSEEEAKAAGAEPIYLKYYWLDREHFLTREAAATHLRQNKHHYNEGRIYVGHFWRNPEVSRLLSVIAGIVGEKIDGL